MAWTIWNAPSDRDYQEQFNPYPEEEEDGDMNPPTESDIAELRERCGAYAEVWIGALAEAQQARDNCNACAKALAAARDEMRVERDTLRGLLRELQRIPTMPFPDRGAHSERAFADAVWRAWSEIQRRIIDALKEEGRLRDKLADDESPNL